MGDQLLAPSVRKFPIFQLFKIKLKVILMIGKVSPTDMRFMHAGECYRTI
jgi:hypothetical protein